jgi:hypothetical protein
VFIALTRISSPDEYTFVTRPVIVRGDHATAGFAKKRIDDLVG